MNTVVIGNFDVSGSSASVGFAHAGNWYNYLTGDSIKVSGTSMVIALAAGEYRVYTDKKIANPYIKQILGGSAKVEDLTSQTGLWVYPNPAQNTIQLGLKNSPVLNGEVTLIDCIGRVVWKKDIAGSEPIHLSGLAVGRYWIRYSSNQGHVYCTQLMIQ